MCNLYSSYTTQEAMRRAFEVTRQRRQRPSPTRNLPGHYGADGADDWRRARTDPDALGLGSKKAAA